MFGNGIRVWVCDIENSLFLDMEKQLNGQSWDLAIVDYDFLKHFGYYHWSELSSHPEIIGLELSSSSRIEIKRTSKKLGGFKGVDLVEQQALFPMYNTILKSTCSIPSGKKRLLILENETGQTHSFKIELDEVLMNQLEFQIQEFGSRFYCTGIAFNNQLLVSDRNDTVMRGLNVRT